MDQVCRQLGREIFIMETCGVHTVSNFRNGIRTSLPQNIKLITGPGCPACAYESDYIDMLLQLTRIDNVVLAVQADLMRVPGPSGSLEKDADRGHIEIVVNAGDAFKLAESITDKIIVYSAMGFSDAAVDTAGAIIQARSQRVKNFCIVSNHRSTTAALRQLFESRCGDVDAVILPPFAARVYGINRFRWIVDDFKMPCLVAGFDPMNTIEGIAEICRQIMAHAAGITVMFDEDVDPQGNSEFYELIHSVFQLDSGVWPGLGRVEKSRYVLKDDMADFDAYKRFDVKPTHLSKTPGCICDQVLCGRAEPTKCPLFDRDCTYENPADSCMAAEDGPCRAYYRWARKKTKPRE